MKKDGSKFTASRKGAWSLGKGTKVHKDKSGKTDYKRLKGKQLMKQIDENNLFRKYFSLVLEQETATNEAPPADTETTPPADEATQADDQAALEKGLDKDTKPADFDVEPMDIGVQTGVVKKITEFIKKIEEFSKYLNSEEGESINKFINEVDKEGSILKGISRESSKVTTVAENLASLAEAFKGQILVALRKHRENQASTEEY